MLLDGAQKQDVQTRKLIDDELEKLTGIRYSEAEKVLYSMGNAPGCHEPVLYVMARLAAEKKISNIIEFGSGMSTLFIQAIGKKYNIPCYSYEDYEEWYILNKKFLAHFDSSYNDNYIYEPHLLKANIPLEHIDLIFIDNAYWIERLKLMFINENTYTRTGAGDPATVILVDDVEIPGHMKMCEAVAKNLMNIDYKYFFSESRGEFLIDPLNKVDFVKFADNV